MSGLPWQKVLATIVQLLERTLIRVGNEEYARENKSFGLTTMKNRHVTVRGAQLRFRFRGKSRRQHEVDVTDRRIAKIVSKCQDLPGQELFQCVGDDGKSISVSCSARRASSSAISQFDSTPKNRSRFRPRGDQTVHVLGRMIANFYKTPIAYIMSALTAQQSWSNTVATCFHYVQTHN